jgi:hypothetical protein
MREIRYRPTVIDSIPSPDRWQDGKDEHKYGTVPSNLYELPTGRLGAEGTVSGILGE